ncbi:hypothetical protein [Bradyrhizobium stylosanthis]|uniref:hypothetical protein n=1 Tax=Bradyrhizobium stylosanthis TaxID=1803665 RepID=UPI0011A0E496|nr:hypothetical protein [Bradyrhizobium stylosanthis]
MNETTDTFDIGTFLKTDGPTTAQELADLNRAIAEGGTFGDYRRVEDPSPKSDRPSFFVYGPNSILFLNKEDVLKLIQAIEGIGFVEESDAERLKAMQVVE